MEQLLFNENAQERLRSGINLISDAVKTTFGPNGKNVIIKGISDIYVTKDGATVAKYVHDSDPFKTVGIQMIKKIAQKTANDVGDGTTTATILAQALVEKLRNVENPIEVSRELEKEVEIVIDFLESNKKNIESLEDLLKVAKVSTNNDEKLGSLVANTFYKVTKDGFVSLEESNDVVDSVSFYEGMKINNGYHTPYFINTNEGTCELEKVYVHTIDIPITDFKQIQNLLEHVKREGLSLLLMAPKIEPFVLRALIANHTQGVLKSCFVISPGFGQSREVLVGDLKIALGRTKTCDKVIVGKDFTLLMGTKGDPQEIKFRKEDIIKQMDFSQHLEEKTFLQKRIANFSGGMATIYAGGHSSYEMREKKDRLEDAIAATKAAMLGGVIPGGGVALYAANELQGIKWLKGVLSEPFNLLIKSSGKTAIKPTNFWQGINVKTFEFGDMYEMGIIDPFQVAKTALENAVSVASMVLTNGCTIINDKNDNE